MGHSSKTEFNMYPLSWEEKMATYAILNMIMKADDVILQSELDYLDSISDLLGITIDDVDRMESFEYDNCRAIVSAMTEDSKNAVAKLFNDMAIADGILDPRETRLIESILL